MGFFTPRKHGKNKMDQSEALNFFSEDKVIGGMILGGFQN